MPLLNQDEGTGCVAQTRVVKRGAVPGPRLADVSIVGEDRIDRVEQFDQFIGCVSVAETDQPAEDGELRLVSVRTALKDPADPQSEDGREEDRDPAGDPVEHEYPV